MLKCQICGREFEEGTGVGRRADRLCSDKCFSDHFWLPKLGYVTLGDKTDCGRLVARVNGGHYILGEESEGGKQFSGMGGRKVLVRFISGEHKGMEVVSTNLWHQGDIPEHLKESMPDNAEFIWGVR